MLIINTASDLTNATSSPECTAFLTALLNDYITFDDAVYPEDYNRTLRAGDTGFIAPVFRHEWNAGVATAWGFDSHASIEAAIEAALNPPTPPQFNADGTPYGTVPEPPLEVEEELV